MLVSSMSKLPNLKAAKQIGLDLETYDPDLMTLGPGVRRTGYTVGIALSVPEGKTWYLPIGHENGKNLPADKVWKWLNEQIISKPDRPMLGANINYDLDYCLENGMSIPGTIRDVLIAGRLLDMQGKFPSLDEMLALHLDEHKTGDELWTWLAMHRQTGTPTRKSQIGYLREAPPDIVAEYAEGDVRSLHKLLEVQEVKLKERSAYEWFLVESDLLPYILRMRRRGIRVDVAAAERLQTEFGKEYTELLDKFGGEAYPEIWTKLSGVEKTDLLNTNSAMRLEPVYKKKGIKLPRTAGGAPSITKPWLEGQTDLFSGLILRLRALSKVTGTFVDSYILKHQINGRIHPELNQLFPRTIRMSSRNPNEQNIPKRDGVLAPLIRGLFLPEEGEDWGRLDYDQQEYRLMVHFSVGEGSQAARDMYNENPDTNFHKMIHEWFPQIESYNTIKNGNFLKVYRGGKAKWAQTLGVEREEGDRLFKLYDVTFPFVAKTGAVAETVARDRGYVKLLLKDMRMYFDHWAIDDWDIRNADPSCKELAMTFVDRMDAVKKGKEIIERLVDEGKMVHKEPKIRKADLYKALNKAIQPSGAQLIKQSMVLLSKSGADAILGPALVSVHDELGLSVPRSKEGAEAFREVAELMIQAGSEEMSVPIKVGADFGPDWGHLKPIEDLAQWRKKKKLKKLKK